MKITKKRSKKKQKKIHSDRSLNPLIYLFLISNMRMLRFNLIKLKVELNKEMIRRRRLIYKSSYQKLMNNPKILKKVLLREKG